MNCMAVDDEKPALDLLADNISKLPYLRLTAKCRNVAEATDIMRKERIDLVFVDIQMPGVTGIQFVQTLPVKPLVIFITAYEKYAIDGYALDVVDYLLKPVALERFIKACSKAYEIFNLKTRPVPDASGIYNEYLFVNVDYSYVKIDVNDIIFLEANKDYTRIYFNSGNSPVLTRMSMKAAAEKLPPGKFIRIHKSYIVAVQHIKVIRKDTVALSAVELPLGINYRENIRLLTGS